MDARRRIFVLLFVSWVAPAPAEPLEEHALLQRCDDYISAIDLDRDVEGWRLRTPPPPALQVGEGAAVHWLLETNVGKMRFELFHDVAPNHVSNAIYLSRLGFYDGLPFHRIIPGFMAQSGSPDGSLLGGPAYRFSSEITKGRRGRHRRSGTLSAAHPAGRHDSDGSQFFITFKAQPSLDGEHTVYGTMIEGRKALRALGHAGTASGKPSKAIRILSARIEVVTRND